MMKNGTKQNWNTKQLREFDLLNFGLSIDSSYQGEDVVNIAPATRHSHVKLGLTTNNRRHTKRVY